MIVPLNDPGSLREIWDIKSSSDGGIIASGEYFTVIGSSWIRHPWVFKTDRFGCFDMGCDPDGIYLINQTASAIACNDSIAELSLETYCGANNVNYYWQSYQDGIWQNLEDSVMYQGIHDDTLIINPVHINSHQEYYRCNYYNQIWSFYTESIGVEFFDPVTILSQPENQLVPFSGSAEFHINVLSESPVSYQWFHDLNMLEGKTDSILLIDVVDFSDTGSYYCSISNVCGSLESEEVHLSISNLGISDQNEDLGIMIRPNPGGRYLYLTSNKDLHIESIKLIDQTGKSLLTRKICDKGRLDYVLDLDNIQQGFYILIITTDKSLIARKVLKK
jgi:hypothetical protein